MSKNVFLSSVAVGFYLGVSLAFASYANASGLLRVNPQNPRYFTDDSGRAIYLGGNQIFGDLQDYGWSNGYTDWQRYLKFARNKNLNFLRNWTIWSTHGGSATPMQYLRTGPGTAADGQAKFDLTQFNPEFFERLRSRIIDAGNNGIYVSIMLFDIYSFGNNLWADNLFNGTNNIQGIDVDDDNNNWGTEFFSPSSAVAQIQKDYVKKVIDTVRDLDNVIFEVANEATAIQWQYDMINFIHSYDESRHLVYMSAGGMNTQGKWEPMNNYDVANSPSDMFAVLDSSGIPYNAPIDKTAKPAVIDTDHTNPGSNDRDLPWRAITRGYHFNLYDHPWEAPQTESADWDLVRSNIGQANRYAENAVNLAGMNPSTSICSTAFCLVSPGVEYLIYAPKGGSFTVNLQSGNYSYEWFNPATASVQGSGTVFADGGNQFFSPQFGGDAVLYLKSGREASDCFNLWNSSLAVPAGFGASFNLFSGSGEFLISIVCASQNTANVSVGNGSNLQYIYKLGYSWQNNQWTSFAYSGSAMDSGGNWFIGNAAKSFPSIDTTSKQSVLAYICDWDGAQWHCGCHDSACAQNFWNLQQFN